MHVNEYTMALTYSIEVYNSRADALRSMVSQNVFEQSLRLLT